MGLLFVDKMERINQMDKNASYKLICMDKKEMDKNHLDTINIGLNGMWTKNNGMKIIWTKLTLY